MTKDGNLRPTFRGHLAHFFWTSVESYTIMGIPDSYFCCNGVSGWIEFKKTDANKIKSLNSDQTSWHAAHARKGGRSFFFVRNGRDLYGFAGTQGDLLLKEGLNGPLPLGIWTMPWNWEEIEQVLLGK